MLDYNILGHNSRYGLAEKVKQACADGWEPVGGVCYANESYLQAMTKSVNAEEILRVAAGQEFAEEQTKVALGMLKEKMDELGLSFQPDKQP